MQLVWPIPVVKGERSAHQISVAREAFGADRKPTRTLGERGYPRAGAPRKPINNPAEKEVAPCRGQRLLRHRRL
jgi:hypothetical protein